MNQLNGYRVIQIAGAALAILMVILMRVDTYTDAGLAIKVLFILVGAGLFFGARHLDEKTRDQKAAAERQAQRDNQTTKAD